MKDEERKRWDKAIEGCCNKPFRDIILEVVEIHNRKSADYASHEDPLQNVRTAEEYGCPAWIGVQFRMDDKRNRIKGAVKKIFKGEKVKMSNESLRDSFIDRIVYGIMALQLLDETQEKNEEAIMKK